MADKDKPAAPAAEYIPLTPAVLQVPYTSTECFSSAEFVIQLKKFTDQIATISARLADKKRGEKFAVTLELDFYRNGVAPMLTVDKDGGKFILNCYCNG